MDKPRYQENIDKLAESLGTNGEQLLRDVRAQAGVPQYPGDECYSPDEVVEFERTGSLPADRMNHIQNCVGCQALLDAVVPNPELVREFREEVMNNRERLQGVAVSSSRFFVNRFPAAMHRARLALAAVVLVIVGGIYHYGNFRPAQTAKLPNIEEQTSQIAQSHAPETSVAVAEFTNSNDSTKVRLKRAVRVKKNGNLTPDSWAGVAATTVVMEGTSTPSVIRTNNEGFVNISLPAQDIQAVSNVVANCYAPVSATTTDEQRAELLAQLRASLEQLGTAKGYKVTFNEAGSDQSGNIQLLRKNRPVAVLNLGNAFVTTQEYVAVLKEHDGDLKALDNRVQNVTMNLVSPGNSKKGSRF